MRVKIKIPRLHIHKGSIARTLACELYRLSSLHRLVTVQGARWANKIPINGIKADRRVCAALVFFQMAQAQNFFLTLEYIYFVIYN
jgi:hypothetical protein